MARFARRFSALAVVLLLGVPAAWAQQQQDQSQQAASGQQKQQESSGQSATSPVSPLPPLSQSQSGKQQSSTQGQKESATLSAPPLTGAEQYTLSRMGAGRSFLVPSLQFAQSVSTNGTGAFGASEVRSVSTLSGSMDLNYLWSRYAFTASYQGTGFLYNQHPELNSSAHMFTLSQRVLGRRSSFHLSDTVTYLPEASFGYARFSGVGSNIYNYGGLFGTNAGNFDTTFIPNQSILTGSSTRISNAVIGEYDYLFSPLSSLTITGSYAILRFPSSNFLENNDAIARIGYNRALTRKDSVAFSYQAGVFRFGQTGGNFTNHVVEFTYRRSVSSRLGIQLGAGPQINIFDNSQPGQQTHVGWEASSLLNYRFRRFTVNMSYRHYTSGGSGIYAGAKTDYAQVDISTALSRMWSVNWDLGYAHNTNLQRGSSSSNNSAFNSWYGSINFQRILNRSTSLFFSYNLQQQLASVPACIGATCGTFYTQQYFSFGLNWHPSRAATERY